MICFILKTEDSQTHCDSTKSQAKPRKLPAIRLQNHEDPGQGTTEPD